MFLPEKESHMNIEHIIYIVIYILCTKCTSHPYSFSTRSCPNSMQTYVVKHKSAKLFMTYAVGKLEAAFNISHLIVQAIRELVR